MKTTTKTMIIAFLLATAAGVVIHNLYSWFPNPFFALLSPVRESLWEHIKLLFYPLLVVSLIFSRGEKASRTTWLLSLLLVCAILLGVSYIYHVTLRGENFIVDLIMYVVLMAAGFLLPRLLWPLGEKPWAQKLAVPLTALLWALIVWFSFYPPEGALFADMGSVRTFFTIPV